MQRQVGEIRVPRESRAAFDAIVQITDEVRGKHLTSEYASLARGLAAALARKRPSPLLKGAPHTWACGVVYALGNVNFLFDPSQNHHVHHRRQTFSR
jgi:hypothetical protein